MKMQLKKIPTTSGSTAKSLVFLPGGPGLSSATLSSLMILSRSFNLYFVDSVQTESYTDDVSYEGLFSSTAELLEEIKDEYILCGHSFGGILATDLIVTKAAQAKGLICIASPFSSESFSAVNSQYGFHKTPELEAAETEFLTFPSNKTFQNWLASYGRLYFKEENIEAGAKMLRNDKSSFEIFLSARDGASFNADLLPMIKTLDMSKLFIAGQSDELFPESFAQRDAKHGGFKFHSIQGAGHFVAFDAPIDTAKVIESEFQKHTGETT